MVYEFSTVTFCVLTWRLLLLLQEGVSILCRSYFEQEEQYQLQEGTAGSGGS